MKCPGCGKSCSWVWPPNKPEAGYWRCWPCGKRVEGPPPPKPEAVLIREACGHAIDPPVSVGRGDRLYVGIDHGVPGGDHTATVVGHFDEADRFVVDRLTVEPAPPRPEPAPAEAVADAAIARLAAVWDDPLDVVGARVAGESVEMSPPSILPPREHEPGQPGVYRTECSAAEMTP